ncbi:unnamed protein product [Polarella glacialis]|uniref:Protein-tyrosine-phosphatase n=1 Tax=Polarella glacialis TaxID=89957 RepID=A0A813DFA2_POLGL|nr:unnamed protein product [Polarella glacialis]
MWPTLWKQPSLVAAAALRIYGPPQAVASGRARRASSGARPPSDDSMPKSRPPKPREAWDFLVDRFVAAVPVGAVGWAARALFWPTLWMNRMLHGRNRLIRGGAAGDATRWYDQVAPGLLLGALPDAALAQMLAREEQVTGVVNMVAEWEGPRSIYEAERIEQLWMPIVDFTSPSPEELDRAVQWIRERTSQGRKVYLHCKAGKGRSGTVAMAYLISGQGMTPLQAQAHLQKCRPQVLRSLHSRPEIQEYWSRHGGGRDADKSAEGS